MISDQKIYEVIELTLELNRDELISDSIESTEHYANHGEPEMAFEGLFFGMFLLKNPKLAIKKEEYIEIAKQLKLDNEPNFRDDFFENFIKFLSKID